MILHLGWPATLVLALLTAWAPIPWGSSRPVFVLWLEVGALGGFVLAMLRGNAGRRLRPVAVAMLLFGLFGLYGFVQTLPLPSWLVGWVSPGHAGLYGAAARAVADASPSWPRLSVAPDVSRGVALWCLALVAAFGAAAAVAERRARRRVLFGAVVVSAVFEAAFGYQQWRADVRTIWGAVVPQPPGRLRGTFVNANHLAFYLGIALAIALAAVWWAARERRWRARGPGLLLVAGSAALWLGLLLAIGMSGSRSGLLAAVTATVVQVAFLAWGGGSRRRGALWVGGAVVLAGVVAALVASGALARLLRTTGYEVVWNDRWIAYRATCELWTRFPLTGTGLGTFREAFPMVQPAGLHEVWRHAHSDWLELLATTGLVGLALMLGATILVCRRLVVLQLQAKRSESRAAALAGLGALAVAAVHSLLDFSLTMPADAFTLAVVVGSAAGAPLGRRRHSEKEPAVGASASPGG